MAGAYGLPSTQVGLNGMLLLSALIGVLLLT